MKKDYEQLLSEALAAGHALLNEQIAAGNDGAAFITATSLTQAGDAYDALWGVNPINTSAAAMIHRKKNPAKRPKRALKED